jgi:hypothetical protein
MTKKQKLAEESNSEEYLHKAAWQVVLRQTEHAEANQQGRSMMISWRWFSRFIP